MGKISIISYIVILQIDTSVGVIKKVNGVFVFHVNNSKRLCRLIHLITFTMLQTAVKVFVEREKKY